jgi:hypothetical protein
MNLCDLRKSITEMAYEEKLALILSIRASRRTSKRAVAAKKPAATKSPKKEIDLDAMIRALPKDQLRKLLGI